MNYHNITKDDMLNGDGLRVVLGVAGCTLHPFNRSEVTRLAKKCKELCPDKTVWAYTGFVWEDVANEEVMKYVDVLADGRFVKELNDNNIHWVGSSNQRVINVPETLRTNKVVLHE